VFGRLDILVNNSAHSETTTIDRLDAVALDRHYAVNLGRVGLPRDAARLVCFLASTEAAWITGQIIRSRGGE
jgi:3-oxoacyl-[acyl-carrier protein] reductase